ncbi:hypothetical protein DPEC_G00379060, partial [Dallia pectoralis]
MAFPVQGRHQCFLATCSWSRKRSRSLAAADTGEGTNPVKRADSRSLRGYSSEADVDDSDVGYTQLDGWCDRSLCPCCQVSFKASEFWKHALFEISDRINVFVQVLQDSSIPIETAIHTLMPSGKKYFLARVSLPGLKELSLEPLWMINGRVQL